MAIVSSDKVDFKEKRSETERDIIKRQKGQSTKNHLPCMYMHHTTELQNVKQKLIELKEKINKFTILVFCWKLQHHSLNN